MKGKQNLAEKIGLLVKNLPELHDREYTVGFNMHENTFFRKLVSDALLEKGVRVKPADYFKALLFLDYFSGMLEGDYKACDNLVIISKKLREAEKASGKNTNASYLNIETVVEEAGLCAAERGAGFYSSKPGLKAIRKRYDSGNTRVDLGSASIRKGEPYYEAIGLKVCELVSEKRRNALENAASRAEVIAVVFTDSILGVIESRKYISDAEAALAKKDYFAASLAALEGLRKEAGIGKLEEAIRKNG